MQKTQAQQEQIIALTKQITERVKQEFTHEELAFVCWNMFGALAEFNLLYESFSDSFDEDINEFQKRFIGVMMRLEETSGISEKLTVILEQSQSEPLIQTEGDKA